jgi:hypothetical protein
MAAAAPAGQPPPDVVTERQRQGWNWAAQNYGEMLEMTAYVKPASDLIIETLRSKYGTSAFTLLHPWLFTNNELLQLGSHGYASKCSS